MAATLRSWSAKGAFFALAIIFRSISKPIGLPTFISLLYDSEGKASQLFPNPKMPQPGFVEGGRKMAVPAPDLWFWLDDHPGTETIYVLASEKPLSDIQGLLGKMESLDEAKQKQASQEIQERIALVQRGVGGITKGKASSYKLSDGKQIQKVTEVVTGAGAVVRAITIQHR